RSSLCCHLFSPLRCPPTPPLFPYTTLFRSEHALVEAQARLDREIALIGGLGRQPARGASGIDPRLAQPRVAPRLGHEHRLPDQRSEEHTSELQSLTNIVCRLLLEQKKKCDS